MMTPLERIADFALRGVEHELFYQYSGNKGESEIEKVLAVAMFAHMNFFSPLMFDRLEIYPQNVELNETNIATLFMRQQVQIKNYRVDFLFDGYTDHSYDEKGTVIYQQKCWKRLVVECDGHDFHERTKEQARRDRSRDRALILDGYGVLRFTGSELWADPPRCASEIIHWFMR